MLSAGPPSWPGCRDTILPHTHTDVLRYMIARHLPDWATYCGHKRCMAWKAGLRTRRFYLSPAGQLTRHGEYVRKGRVCGSFVVWWSAEKPPTVTFAAA